MTLRTVLKIAKNNLKTESTYMFDKIWPLHISRLEHEGGECS